MSARSWPALLALACHPAQTEETPDRGADADADTDADTDTDTDPPAATGDTGVVTVPVAACADAQFTTAPVDWATTTVGAADDWTPSDDCAWPYQAGVEDVTVEFVAPAAGTYAFWTRSTVDVVLALADACGAAETDCSGGVGDHLLLREMAAGERVLVILDTQSVPGDVELSITSTEADCADGLDEDWDGDPDCADPDCAAAPNCAPACPDAVLSAPGTFSGFTGGLPDEVEGSCNWLPHVLSRTDPELGVEFTAPAAGRYLARTTSSVIFATNGCGGPEIGCANPLYDPSWSKADAARGPALAFDLGAGQSVVVYSETYDGVPTDFDLTVTEIPASETACADGVDEDFDRRLDCGDPDCAAEPACQPSCPDRVASGALPISVRGTTIGAADEPSLACSGGTGVPEETIGFEAPAAGRYTFTLQSGDAWMGDLLRLELSSGCGEPEDVCFVTIGTADQWRAVDDRFATSALFTDMNTLFADLAAGESVVLTYQPLAVEAGEYEVVIDQVPATEVDCADGVDEDRDSAADCADPDCGGANSCQPACEPAAVAAGAPVEGDTFGRPWTLPSACGSYSGASQALYSFVAPATATYGFDVDAPSGVTLAVFDSCGGAERTCAWVGAEPDWQPEVVSLAMTAGESVVVVVESTDAPATAFDLTVFAEGPEVCGDSVDNDLDYRPDCYDGDCEGQCAETCGNGLDDDRDGLLDCLDPDCAGDASCADACPEATLTPELGWVVVAPAGHADDYQGSCGQALSSDATVSFTAPADGRYVFDAAQEDAAVYVLSDCAGSELSCGVGTTSVDLLAGETVVVVYDLDHGAALSARPDLLFVE